RFALFSGAHRDFFGLCQAAMAAVDPGQEVGGRGLVQRIPALFGRAHRAFHCDEGEVLLAEGDGDTGGGLACGGQHPEGGGLVGGGEFPGGVAGVGDQVGEEPRDRVIAAVLVETPYVGGGGAQRGQVRCNGGVVAAVGESG